MAEEQQVSKDERIGFHKGSLSTLAKEREELVRMVNIVEQLIQMHLGGLKELGVDLEKDGATQAAKGQTAQQQEKKKPIEDIL